MVPLPRLPSFRRYSDVAPAKRAAVRCNRSHPTIRRTPPVGRRRRPEMSMAEARKNRRRYDPGAAGPAEVMTERLGEPVGAKDGLNSQACPQSSSPRRAALISEQVQATPGRPQPLEEHHPFVDIKLPRRKVAKRRSWRFLPAHSALRGA